MDIVNVWGVSTAGGVTTYTSMDYDGDGILGIGFIDGPFIGFSANFNFVTAVLVPAAIWLFGSGVAGLFGFSGVRKT